MRFSILNYSYYVLRHPQKNFKEFSYEVEKLTTENKKILRTNTLVKNVSLWIDNPVINYAALTEADIREFKNQLREGKTLSEILRDANVGLIVVESESELLKFSYLLYDFSSNPNERTALITQNDKQRLTKEQKQYIYDSFELISISMDHNIYRIKE